MPSALVVGCGYLGQATAHLFHARGWHVQGWTSSPESAEKLAANPFGLCPVDLTDRAQVAAAASPYDVVIDCVSTRGGDADAYRRVYLQGARNLLESLPATRFIFTSSTSVYGQTDGSWTTEMSAAEPSRETGRILRETEEFVLAKGGLVARLAGLYGPGRSFLLKKFLAGEATMDGDGSRFINQVHRDDAAAALWSIAKEEASGIYNVADGTPLTQLACNEWLAARFSRPMPPFAPLHANRKRGVTNKRVSNEKLRALGWSPAYPDFPAGIERSVLPAIHLLGIEAPA